MGVDCKILLPEDVRVDDVANVIGILAGLKAEPNQLDGGAVACRVPGTEVRTTCVPEMVWVLARAPKGKTLVDGEPVHHGNYFFEPDGGSGRLLYVTSNVFWVAVGIELVKFFGGKMDYNDCDSVRWNFRRRPKRRNNPSDGKAWQDFENSMLALKSLTPKDLKKANKYAAYKMDEQ